MKKVLRGLLCASVAAGMLLGNAQCIFAGDTGATYSVTTDATEVKVGDSFTVYVKVANNTQGINAITGYLDFDPAKVQPVKAATSASAIGEFMTASALNGQISLKPSSANADYTGLNADGTKTAAELGRVKVAGYLYDSASKSLNNATGDGDLFAVEFKSLAEGEAKITFNAFKATDATITDVDVTSQSAEGTFTAASGGGSNPTPGGSYKHYAGDLDHSGRPDSGDASAVIRSIVTSDKILAGTDEYIIANVNGNDRIDSEDAACIIKSIVDKTYTFPVGETVEVSKEYANQPNN